MTARSTDPGFVENVRGKLAGYTWNLIRDYPVACVHEIDDATVHNGLPAEFVLFTVKTIVPKRSAVVG